MKGFTDKFEDHKIPEWYDRYFDYSDLKKVVRQFKDNPLMEKLEGFFSVQSNPLKVVEVTITPKDH